MDKITQSDGINLVIENESEMKGEFLRIISRLNYLRYLFKLWCKL